MRSPAAPRRTALLGAALACALVPAAAATGVPKPDMPAMSAARVVPLDLPADFSPSLCGGSVHLFSSGGRNQTLAPGESAPACNLLHLVPAADPVCGPDGPVVLTRDGTLWSLGASGPAPLEQDLSGAVGLAARPGTLPAVLFPDRIRLPGGESVRLPFPAQTLDALEGGGFFVGGEGTGARVSPEGKILWAWKGGLTPTGACAGEGFIAAGTREGFLVALDGATGRERFRYITGAAIPSPPAIASGLAVFASRDHLARAVRLKDGQLAWQVRLDGRPDFGPMPTRAGLLFAVSAGATLTALSPSDGRRTWTWRLPSGVLLQSPAAATDRVAVLAWGETENPTLYLVPVPEPPPAPAHPKRKARREGPDRR